MLSSRFFNKFFVISTGGAAERIRGLDAAQVPRLENFASEVVH
jgi:hypothetical protein